MSSYANKNSLETRRKGGIGGEENYRGFVRMNADGKKIRVFRVHSRLNPF